MITKIDINSDEFLEEKGKTQDFVNNVYNKMGWVKNPNDEVNESILVGLTRNKIIYGTRYCPCFMVKGETKEERRGEDNRICPCKPAIAEEIPNDGYCHCGIYCTPEFAKERELEDRADEVAHEHSRGLTKEECEALLNVPQLDSDDIEALVEARELGFVDFKLVDVREWNEWVQKRIKGTDYLVPTTSFYEAVSQIDELKETPIIVYCFSGSRSRYVQRIMHDMGYKHVSNFRRGIMTYRGEAISGE